MKKTILIGLVLSLTGVSLKIIAQQLPVTEQKENMQRPDQAEKPERPERPPRPERRERPERPEGKEEQEIIIRSKADTNITLKVEINGDKILINGKPLVEFKDGGITINKRKMMYRDAVGNMNFNFEGLEGLEKLKDLQINMDGNFENFGKALNGNKEFQKLHNMMPHKTFLGVTTEKAAEGAKIVEIVKGAAAEKAGLQMDDVITKIDKQIVTNADVLASIIATKKPSDEIKIYFKRAGKKKAVKAVLGESNNMAQYFNFNHPPPMVRSFKLPPINNDNMDNENEEGDNGDNFAGDFPHPKRLGLKIQDTEEGGNVKIIEVADSSAAAIAGLKKEDIITAINGQQINNTDEAREQLQQANEQSMYMIKVKRAGEIKDFEIKFPKKLKTANL